MPIMPDDRRTTPPRDVVTDDWVVRVSRDAADVQISHGQPAGDADLQVLFAGQLHDTPDVGAGTGIALVPTPAEAIARAFRQRGAALLPSLRGRFAFIVIDRTARTVRAVRDHLGLHPLFYALTPREIVFSSSFEKLRQEPGVPRDLNRIAIADHLCQYWPVPEETFFLHVRRILAGSQAIVSPAGMSIERYWSPIGDRLDWLPDEEVDRFDALLDQAVARGLASGRAGIFLSGGFDSVSVAAVAADLSRTRGDAPPLALSLSFPDPSADERPIQTAVADTLGLPLHLEGLLDAAGSRGLLAESLALSNTLSAPLFNHWTPAYLSLMRRAQRDGVSVIFTGEGGDEWLGTSPFLAADLIARGDVAGLIRLGRTWRRSFHLPWLAGWRSTIWTFGLRPLAGAALASVAPDWWDDNRARRRVAAHPDWITADAELRGQQLARARRALIAARPPGGFYQRDARALIDMPLHAWFFEEQHEVGHRLGLYQAHPYWDADLVAHMYRVRPERLNAANRTKALVRQTVHRRFPALGFERQRKVTATQVFSSIVAAEAPVLGESVANFEGLASLGVVDPARAAAFMRAAFGQSVRPRSIAWALIEMEHWVRTQAA
jgi:asparagine synthetase B (glutamine-hydrolysing)